MLNQKIYFPHLNGIRFTAALLVIIHHIEQLKGIYGLPTLWGGKGFLSHFISIIGPQGVVLFFVLSGFLITYLLLAEEAKTETINIKKFYIRRILRIWPLYLLVIFLSLFVLVHFDFFTLPGFNKSTIQENIIWKLILFILFFSNFVLVFFGVVPYASQTWSIGTEEQFYLVWPIIIKFIKRNRLLLMILIALGYNVFRLFLMSRHSLFIPESIRVILQAFWNGFTIDCMAIGGFFAVLLYEKSKITTLLLNNWVFYLSIIFVIGSWSINLYIPYLHSIYYSALYALIILNFASNPKQHINLENRYFNYLGNISYSIYMLHPIGITIAIQSAIFLNIISNWIVYPIAILSTILLSGLSYRWYESYFLKFKSRFAIVKSGSEE